MWPLVLATLLLVQSDHSNVTYTKVLTLRVTIASGHSIFEMSPKGCLIGPLTFFDETGKPILSLESGKTIGDCLK